MWNTISSLKENLSQIASEVLDTAEELDIAQEEAGSQADGSHGGYEKFLRPKRSERRDHERNGVDFQPGMQELQMKCQNLEAQAKELFSQLQAKERAYMLLNESYEKASTEAGQLREALANSQEELNSQLTKEREDAEFLREACSRSEEANSKMKMQLSAYENQKGSLDEDNFAREPNQRDETIKKLEHVVTTLEQERSVLQAELKDLKAEKPANPVQDAQTDSLQQVQAVLEQLREVQEAHRKERKQILGRLEAVSLERDKAVGNLSRLKQHLLDKENEDTEKMDRDSEQIALLEKKAAMSNARILQLEQALSHTMASQMDSAKKNNGELQTLRQQVESMEKKLSDCYTALEAKEVELVNLQGALGQYYAESDAKERLLEEVRILNDKQRKLLLELQDARGVIDAKEAQVKEALERIETAEQRAASSQERTKKCEQDMLRLRHALEQSMIRLNRMSSDSDFAVDRRLVIKLLVTYFERNHSREVLDLMARILGFSDEDKRRVGLAQQNRGKAGVVRSVLGLPGRVVGGIMGGSGPEATAVPSGSQSFSDLWIDFLLKESEERDRREKAELELAADRSLVFDASPEES